jgi:hypothetical protein
MMRAQLLRIVAMLGLLAFANGCFGYQSGVMLRSSDPSQIRTFGPSVNGASAGLVLNDTGQTFFLDASASIGTPRYSTKAAVLNTRPAGVVLIIHLPNHSQISLIRFDPSATYALIDGRKVHPRIKPDDRTEELHASETVHQESRLNGSQSGPIELKFNQAARAYTFELEFDTTYEQLTHGELHIDGITLNGQAIKVSPISIKYGGYWTSPSPI